MKKLVLAAAAALVLAGCQSAGAVPQEKSADEKTVHITAADQDGKTIFDEDVTTEAKTLTDVLKNCDELDAKLEDGQYGTMVMGLAGTETEDWNKGPWWTYESANNEVCQKESYCPAADDVLVEDGDNFVFTFSMGS